MKKFLLLAALTLSLGACQGGKITAAEGALATCETYAVTLSVLADFRAAGKLDAGTVKVVDQTVAYVGPYCRGAAPDVDSDVKDVAVDAGVRVLQSVLTNLL